MIRHVSFVVGNSGPVALVSIYLPLLSFAISQSAAQNAASVHFQLNQRRLPSSLNPTQFLLRTLDLISSTSAKQKPDLTIDGGLSPPSLSGLIGVICWAEITQPASPGGHVTRAPVTSPRQRFVKNKQTEGRSPGGAPLS